MNWLSLALSQLGISPALMSEHPCAVVGSLVPVGVFICFSGGTNPVQAKHPVVPLHGS